MNLYLIQVRQHYKHVISLNYSRPSSFSHVLIKAFSTSSFTWTRWLSRLRQKYWSEKNTDNTTHIRFSQQQQTKSSNNNTSKDT